MKDLWEGKIHPQELCLCHTAEQKQLLTLIEGLREKLENMLSQEQKEMVEMYLDYLYELHSLNECITFTYAFRLGGKMMLETITEENK